MPTYMQSLIGKTPALLKEFLGSIPTRGPKSVFKSRAVYSLQIITD